MTHYAKEELDLYRSGQMSLPGRITCSAHLRKCEKCRSLLDELKEDDRLIADLRSGIQIYQELSEEAPPQRN